MKRLAGAPETELYLKTPHDFEGHSTISYFLTLGFGVALLQHWNSISLISLNVSVSSQNVP